MTAAVGTSTGRSVEVVALSWILARRVGLPPLEAAPVWSALDGERFVSEAVRHRVVGLTSSAPDVELLPASVLRLLLARNRILTMRAMSQAASLVPLLDSYQAAGIPLLLLKGQPLSAALYGDWAARGVSADADFLIPPDRIAEAHHLMLGLGYDCEHDLGHKAPLTGLRGRYNRWLHYERRYMADDRLTVDLHWRPVPGSSRWTRFGALWAGRANVDLHGRTVIVPGNSDLLRVVAGQGVADGWPTLRAACDVLAAELLVQPNQFRDLRSDDRLVYRAAHRARTVLLKGNPTWLTPSARPRPRQLRQQWDLRNGTDALPRALARSVLGMWVPARRLMPVDLKTARDGVNHFQGRSN